MLPHPDPELATAALAEECHAAGVRGETIVAECLQLDWIELGLGRAQQFRIPTSGDWASWITVVAWEEDVDV